MLFKNRKKLHKEAVETNKMYEDLLVSATSELSFQAVLNETLYNLVSEVRTLIEDPAINDRIILSVIENGIERYNLDKIIHIKKIFPNPQGFTQEFINNVLQEEEDTA